MIMSGNSCAILVTEQRQETHYARSLDNSKQVIKCGSITDNKLTTGLQGWKSTGNDQTP